MPRVTVASAVGHHKALKFVAMLIHAMTINKRPAKLKPGADVKTTRLMINRTIKQNMMVHWYVNRPRLVSDAFTTVGK